MNTSPPTPKPPATLKAPVIGLVDIVLLAKYVAFATVPPPKELDPEIVLAKS